MIHVDKTVSVNEGRAPDEPPVSRAQVWEGLMLKAENALPFVAAMTHCEILERTDVGLIREIVFRGEKMKEKITFNPQKSVKFERLSGQALGTILNEILEDPSKGLQLRFTFTIELQGVDAGSVQENEFRQMMEKDYLTAVEATVKAIRRLVKEGQLIGAA
jgi:hypothetical protein